jgi:hypothetical protein
MIEKLIPIIHLLITAFLVFYPFLIKTNFFYDYLYISVISFVILLWIYFLGECPISYFYKKYKNPDYICGQTTTLDDIKEFDFLPKTENSVLKFDNFSNVFRFIANVLLIVSVVIVSFRTNLTNPFLVIFVCIFLRYFYIYFNDALGGLDGNDNIIKLIMGDKYSILEDIYWNYGFDKLHHVVNNGIATFIIGFWIYISCKNRKKLQKFIM